MLQESIADPRADPSTADLVLERLPNGEFAWLRPESGHSAPSEPPVHSPSRRDRPRICPVCRRQRPLQPRRIRIRRGVGRAHGPPAHSPRLTARRGGFPMTPVWCFLFWLAIAIWALFVLSSVSWEITR